MFSFPESALAKEMGKANIYDFSQASLVAQMVKNLPAVHETWVWALNWEDPLEKGMAA